MSLSTKILLIIGSILTLGLLSFIAYKQVEISTRQQAIEAQVISQKQLVDGIVRSQSSWATKDDVDKFIKDNGVNLKAIQEDLDKLHAEITAATTIVVDSKGQHTGNLPSTNTGTSNPNPSNVPDPYGYLAKQQNLAISEDFGTVKVPIGSIGFSAWQAAPWNIDIKAREYHVSSVIGTDENQKVSVYNKFAVKVDGKAYDVPIKTATTEQVYPTAKFSFFNPRLFLATSGGVGVRTVQGEFTPSLNVGIMSYGKYKTQPDFSVLQVGVGFGVVSRKPQVLISPGAYNVGQHIPLMHNLYIGPTVGIGTDGNVFVMGSLAVAL
jgi:hypothetical protein